MLIIIVYLLLSVFVVTNLVRKKNSHFENLLSIFLGFSGLGLLLFKAGFNFV